MSESNEPELVSVVIPAYNAAETIADQLDALVGQVDAPQFEVIVADNGSTDGTAEMARSFEHRLRRLRVVDASARAGASHARNTGAAVASGPVLLFCDSDDVVGPRWVAALSGAVHRTGMATGPAQFVSATVAVVWPLDYTGLQAPRLYLERIPFADSANLGISAELFDGLGGFDEELPRGMDADLSVRAAAAGVSLTWCPEALIAARRRGSTRATMSQYYKFGLVAPSILARNRASFDAVRKITAAEVLRNWAKLWLTCYRVLSPRRRMSWLQSAALRWGRTVGSIRERVLCP